MEIKRLLFFFIIAFQCNAQVSDFNHIDFNKADRIALECKNEILNNLPNLAFKLTSELNTDVEKFRAIYIWVCSNISNDYKLFTKNNRKRNKFKDDSLQLLKWNNLVNKTIYKSLLKEKKTICTGYTYLVKELSLLANLNCEVIQGFGRTSSTDIENFTNPNHSWNAVKLNNKWYLCDPTWASGLIDFESHIFKFQYNDGYFLTNPKLFAKNHYPANQKWLLLDETLTFKEFLEVPIMYGNAYSKLEQHYYPSKFKNSIRPKEKVAFKYKLQEQINTNDVRLVVNNGFSDRKIKPETVTLENDTLTFEHEFKSTGYYDVHLYLDDDIISTYTFNVKRSK